LPSPDLALGDEDIAVLGPDEDIGLACRVQHLAGGGALELCVQGYQQQVPAGPLMQDLAGQGGGGGLHPRLAGIALNAWASVLGFLTPEIFGSLTRLIADTDELYRAHVHTVMLGMGFGPDLTSTAAARSSMSAGRSNGHRA
jgi:hypothetical protein